MFKPLYLFPFCLLSLPLLSQPCSDGSDPEAVTVSLAGEQTFDEIGDFDNTILTAVFSGPRRIVGIIADDITVSPIGASFCSEAVIGIGGAVDYRPSLQDNVGPCADNPSSGSFNLSDLALDFESATGIVNLELFESFDDNFNAADATFTTGSITLLGCPVGETLLPVELISFRAAALEKKVRLEWVTATEQDNAGFTVQRSTDGTSWRPIGWVDGNGAATAEQRYDFLDEQVAPATTYYYRLEQRDFDGATELSEVREVTTALSVGSIAGEVYPNPTDGQGLSLALRAAAAANIELSVLSADGRLITTRSVRVAEGLNRIEVPTSTFRTGTYVLRFVLDGEPVRRTFQVTR